MKKNINKKHLLIVVLFAILVAVNIEIISSRYTFAYARAGHDCLPYKLWIIHKGVDVKRGDYIAFTGKGIPNFADGVRWVKIYLAGDGDRVEVSPILDGSSQVIEKNGIPIKIPNRAIVKVISSQGEVVLPALAHDTKGRELPLINSQTLNKDSIFVTAPGIGSFDSRYWGVIDRSQVIGKAIPIL